MNGYGFDSLSADVTTGPELGINATANMTNFRTGAVLLEASQMEIRQDSDAMRLNVRIENSSKRNPNRFTATLDGSLLSDGFNLMANFKDAKGR